jgi:hypothetical protein
VKFLAAEQLLTCRSTNLVRGGITHEITVQEKAAVAFLLTNWSQTWYSTSKVDIGTITQNSLHRPWRIRLARLFKLWANEIGMTDCIAVRQSINRFTPSPSLCLIGRTPFRSCCTLRRNLYQPLRPPTVFQCTIPKLLLSLWCRFHQQLRHRSIHHLGIVTVPTQRTPQLSISSCSIGPSLGPHCTNHTTQQTRRRNLQISRSTSIHDKSQYGHCACVVQFTRTCGKLSGAVFGTHHECCLAPRRGVFQRLHRPMPTPCIKQLSGIEGG